MVLRFAALLTAALTSLAPAIEAAASPSGAAEPYTVTVWASAEFDEAGRVRTLNFHSLTDHAPEFLEKVRPVLMRARVTPPSSGDVPATFESGLRVTLRIVPSQQDGNRFSVTNLLLQPLPLRTFAPEYNAYVRGGHPVTFSVTASCLVDSEGRCGRVSVTSEGGVPESFRDAVRRAYQRWEFAPQKINGKAVPGEASMAFLFTQD
jgi:hypothetical protein